MKELLHLAIFLLLPTLAGAQTYFPIKHANSTQLVGIIPVTESGTGGMLPGIGTVCGEGPYDIGVKRPPSNDPRNNHRFEFAYPVNAIRLKLVNIGGDDSVAVDVNGTFFPINASHISNSLTAQIACLGEVMATDNGKLCPPIVPPPGNNNSKAHIDIKPGYPIHEINIRYISAANSGNGAAFSIAYATDPHVYIKEPFTDTIMCAGDTIQIGMKVTDNFNAGNTFKIQLSDASGNFANGTIIGSRQSDTTATILCSIPDNFPEGTNYRFRVISTIPADTSASNVYPIRIAHYPTLSLSSNSPLCNGETLTLNAASNNTNLKWTGPGGFTSTIPNPSLPTTMQQNGEYNVTADNYGCLTKVATQVQIKPIPKITLVRNNSPKCETEEIVLEAKASDTAAKFSWTGPGAFGANDASPRLPGALISANGLYSVVATLNGCISPADTTRVTIYPQPEKPVISVNNPVKPGDSILFHATGNADATYQWIGPGGFNSTEQNPIKRLVDVSDEGEYIVESTIGDCSSSSSVLIDVLQGALSYYLTPNPNKGDIRIYGNYLVGKTIPFEIVSSTGQAVYSGQVNSSGKFLDMKLDLQGRFSKGLYFIRLQLKDEMLKIKFVIDE